MKLIKLIFLFSISLLQIAYAQDYCPNVLNKFLQVKDFGTFNNPKSNKVRIKNENGYIFYTNPKFKRMDYISITKWKDSWIIKNALSCGKFLDGKEIIILDNNCKIKNVDFPSFSHLYGCNTKSKVKITHRSCELINKSQEVKELYESFQYFQIQQHLQINQKLRKDLLIPTHFKSAISNWSPNKNLLEVITKLLAQGESSIPKGQELNAALMCQRFERDFTIEKLSIPTKPAREVPSILPE